MPMTNQHMLSGYRLLDLTRAVAGPTCTRMFAEMGAEVIKVESAPNGDMSRSISKLRNDRSLYFVQQSLNKKSLCVDLRTPEGLALVRELVPHCDVVVENFKPGVIAKMGLGYDALCELKEDIILCSISSLGQTGPLSSKPGYDFIAQAYAGITSMIGDPNSAPSLPLAAIGDVSTGVTAAFAVAAALLDRHKTGKGQMLDVSILDCYYHYHEVNVHQASGSNGAIVPHRNGSHFAYICPAGVYKASGGYVVLAAFLHHWPDLCTAMNRPELAADEAWATDPARLANIDVVIETIEQWMQTFPDVDSLLKVLDAHNVPCAPVLTVNETLTYPHLVERGTVRTVKDKMAGEFQIPGHPVKSSRYAANNAFEAPLVGEHNRDILKSVLGKNDNEIDSLTAAGVLQSKDL
ncbi:MAG: CaiB/BaiF CoA-transferase family protein [Proteobacteria bacterium]|nr:CaiB/BaiF CoA-transferase family protein [Pseudomonadota bacterium]